MLRLWEKKKKKKKDEAKRKQTDKDSTARGMCWNKEEEDGKKSLRTRAMRHDTHRYLTF